MRLRRWFALSVPMLVAAAVAAPEAAAADPATPPLRVAAAADQRPTATPLQMQAAAGQALASSCGQGAPQLGAGLPDGARVYCVHPTATPNRALAAGPAAGSTAPAVPDWCPEAGATWFHDRSELCRVTSAAVDIAVKKGDALVPIGGINFRLSSDLKTKPTSTVATEDFSIAFTGGWGETAGLTVDFEVICTGTCGAATSFPHNAPVLLGETLPATIEYTDAPNGIDHVVPTYTLIFKPTAPGLPGATSWESLGYRCDSVLSGAGCVIDQSVPHLTTMVQLPNIADNIRRIQNAGPNHYGAKALGGKPLHRTTNDALAKANRQAACPDSRPRPSGQSCDEYPFARTQEGASVNTQPDWGWAWVPEGEQNSQGGFIASFYASNRILDGDPFWVDV